MPVLRSAANMTRPATRALQRHHIRHGRRLRFRKASLVQNPTIRMSETMSPSLSAVPCRRRCSILCEHPSVWHRVGVNACAVNFICDRWSWLICQTSRLTDFKIMRHFAQSAKTISNTLDSGVMAIDITAFDIEQFCLLMCRKVVLYHYI